MIASRMGSSAEVTFLRELLNWDVESPTASDWKRIAELTAQYADLGLGGTDASVVALAERTGASQLITLDRRHFTVVRPAHVKAFELLPG